MTTVTAHLPATVNLNAYHGDTFTQLFRFLNGSTPLDLTGLQFRAVARSSTGQRTELPVSVIDDGTIQLSADLPADLYRYDIQATTPQDTVSTWVRGAIRVTPDVT